MLPPLHFQGLGASQPFGYQPPPAAGGMPPARMAGVQAGMVRNADQMEGDDAAELPPPKRQKVAKLPGGALYPEEDWIAMHPVSLLPMARDCLYTYVNPSETSTLFLSKYRCRTIHPNLNGSCRDR